MAAQVEWLAWMHDIFQDAKTLFLYQINPNQTISHTASSPIKDEPDDTVNNAVLSCVHGLKASSIEIDANNNLLAVPLLADTSDDQFVLVIAASEFSQVQKNTAIQLAQWASTRLCRDKLERLPTAALKKEFTAGSHGDGHAMPEYALASDLLQSLDRHSSMNALAFTLVNKVSELCGCVRVSLGHHDGKKLQLIAMSGQSKIDDRRTIARQLCGLMQETMEFRRGIYPCDDEEAKPAIQSYYQSQGEHPLLSFVLPSKREDQFVLVLEREKGEAFATAQADAIEHSLKNTAALLALTCEQQLPLRTKVHRRINKKVESLSQFSQWSFRQMLLAAALFALLLSAIVPVTHRISADAYIEASDQQVLVAAQNGFILSSHARAGEFVNEGDLLATLDNKELQLDADKWLSEKEKNEQEYAQALSVHDRSELSRLRADAKRIDAEIALVDQQLSRSEIRAPFTGVIMQGDWTQSLGAPVATGDVLFEIASAEQYRLVLEVDEHDIGYIEAKQLAQLRMAALPASVWEATLSDVLPVAVSEKGRSTFRIPATITGDAGALRPGMEGIGKVDVGQRSMFWVYSHSLFDRLKYYAWKMGLI